MKQISKVNVDALVHAEWNPRKESELQPEHPEMVKLTASVKKNGLIEPIGVWCDGGQKVVIYGNRRLEAVRLAGFTTVDAVVYTGIDEATARILTREENENRFGVDPLMDAALIKQAVQRGKSQSEIAAGCGVSEATICRRMKLADLTDEAIDILKGHEIDAKALEEIANWPDAIQKRAVKDIKDMLYHRTDALHVRDVRPIYDRYTKQISDNSWPFNGPTGSALLSRCKTCGLCSGNQPELFATSDDDGAGDCRCMDVACYRRVCCEARDAAIRAKIGDGIAFTLCSSWESPYSGVCQKRRSKKSAHAWVVWDDWRHEVAGVKYGPTPDEWAASEKRRKEDERAAQKAKDAANRDARAALDSACAKIVSALLANRDEAVDGPNIVDRLNQILSGAIHSHAELYRALWFDLGLTPELANIDEVLPPEDVDDSTDELFSADLETCIRAACDLFAGALALKISTSDSGRYRRGEYIEEDPRVRKFLAHHDEQIQKSLEPAELMAIDRACEVAKGVQK